jgi:glycerophosphoryl diester phosphodiesterase
MSQPTAWPYPRHIAHRGAGKLAPENTLAAFRLGAAHGYRMFECDVKLSRDEVPFLLHDHRLERTSSGLGAAGGFSWSELAQLDAGAWHSRAYAGETLPSLQAVAAYCLANGLALNIEIKPSEGLEDKASAESLEALERRTGEVVAAVAARLWQGQAVPPLLSSFKPAALAGAQTGATHLPRALLLDRLWDGWLNCATRLGCVAIVCHYSLWTPTVLASVKTAGLRALSYTVNDVAIAKTLLDMGTDGVITDRVDLLVP